MSQCVDHYSKFLSMVPLHDKKATTVANVFLNKILPFLPKVPENVLSDNGPEFISRNFLSVLNKCNINAVKSVPFSPSSNGAVERVNRTMIQILKGLANKPGDWDLHLPKAIISYNNTFHSQIGMSPAQCILSKSYSVRNNSTMDQEVIDTW